MADEADLANDRYEIELSRSLAAIQRAAGPSLAECQDCGDDIPEARRAAVAGCRQCIDCANRAHLMTQGVRRG